MRRYYLQWKGYTRLRRHPDEISQLTSTIATLTKTVTNTVTTTRDVATRSGTNRTRRSSMTLKRVAEASVSIDAESSEEIALIRNTMGMFFAFLLHLYN